MQARNDDTQLATPRFPWLLFLRALVRRLDRNDVGALSAQISYYFGLALFPFLIVLGALVGVLPFTHLWDGILAWITHYLPSDVQGPIFDTIASLTHGRKRFLSLGLLGTVWAASGGLMALTSALNAVYEVRETRSYWRRLAVSALMLLVLAVLVIATFGLLSAGSWLDRGLGLVAGPHLVLALAAHVARWIVSIALTVICITILDHTLPDRKCRWRWITPGTAVVVAGWVLGTAGFNLYVVHIASYHKTYGILGAFFVLMVWIYISSLIGLVGASINSELERVWR